MSLRTRLTIWYVGLLAALLVVSGAAVYAVISLSSYNEVDRTLENRASDIEKSVDAALAVQRNPGQVFRQGGILLPGADVFADSDIYVQISRPDGTPVSKSDNLRSQTLNITPDQLSQVSAGHSLFTLRR
jgi:hypothetical protein